MPSGGARNHSGPPKDPNSLRGASRAGLRALPAKEFNRAHPEFPLPHATGREVELWNNAWQAPQAWAWIEEPWRWHVIALWVRRSAMAESDEASASDVNAMIRLADQIGMTPAGLTQNGWTIGAAGSKADSSTNSDGEEEADKVAAEPERTSAKHRFKVVDGGAGAA